MRKYCVVNNPIHVMVVPAAGMVSAVHFGAGAGTAGGRDPAGMEPAGTGGGGTDPAGAGSGSCRARSVEEKREP